MHVVLIHDILSSLNVPLLVSYIRHLLKKRFYVFELSIFTGSVLIELLYIYL